MQMVNILHYLHHRHTRGTHPTQNTAYSPSKTNLPSILLKLQNKMDHVIKFTPSQTNHFSPFPIGCPVWFFPFEEDDNANEERGSYSIMAGVVSSISFDTTNSKLLYDVSHNEKVIGRSLEERELAYAFQCPVVVSPSNEEINDDGKTFDAVVLQARRVEGLMVYTVMHSVGGGYSSYKEGIAGDRVKYRLDEPAVGSAVDDQDATAVVADSHHDEKEEQVVPFDDRRADEQAAKPPVAEVSYASAGSIDCDSKVTHDSKTPAESLLSHNNETTRALQGATCGFNNLEPSPGLKSMESPTEMHASKRAKLSDGKVEMKHPSFNIVLPTWLQKDKEMKDRLYAHLYGPKDDPHYKRMRKEANCNMIVHRNSDTTKRLSIEVTHLKDAPASKEFIIARRMIQEILLKFQLPGLPPIGEDGSRGRLIYGIANSCAGAHRPRESQSHAVTQQMHPFGEKGSVCISLVELPTVMDGGRKCFHGQCLNKDWFHSNIRNRTHCSMYLCGDEFNMSTKYGDPYVLLVGKPQGWRDVDEAVRMVIDEIRKHQRNCNCE